LGFFSILNGFLFLSSAKEENFPFHKRRKADENCKKKGLNGDGHQIFIFITRTRRKSLCVASNKALLKG
jgi:hypothetical protein